MAGKVLVNGTSYNILRGRTLVNGTGYSINKGRTLVNGTGYPISFTTREEVVITVVLFSHYVGGNTVHVYVNDKLVGIVWSDEGGEEYFKDFNVHVGDVVRAVGSYYSNYSPSSSFTNVSTYATTFTGTVVTAGDIYFDAG